KEQQGPDGKAARFQIWRHQEKIHLWIASANWRSFMMRTFDQATWPPHIRKVFAAIGEVMRCDRLYPDDLASIPLGLGSILPHHLVAVSHIAARDIGTRKGRYRIPIEGPRY